MAALYKQLNQADSLVKYTEMARVANDSAYASMTTEKLLHMKTLYDYGQQQRIASDERERADNALLAIVLIVASFVVILLVFFVFYYRKLLFKEKENERMQKEWHEMELENRKHRENIRMLKQTKEDLNVLLRQYEGEIEQLVKEKLLLWKICRERYLNMIKTVRSGIERKRMSNCITRQLSLDFIISPRKLWHLLLLMIGKNCISSYQKSFPNLLSIKTH